MININYHANRLLIRDHKSMFNYTINCLNNYNKYY